jgi:hypothetical protein
MDAGSFESHRQKDHPKAMSARIPTGVSDFSLGVGGDAWRAIFMFLVLPPDRADVGAGFPVMENSLTNSIR